jgi:outer membrane protein OmpA-like peptidoglycan-associated protein
MKKTNLLFTLALLFLTYKLIAQGSKPVVLISGKVLNERNMKVIDAEIKIIYEELPSGKEAGIARPNPLNGEYRIILPYGKKYGYMAFAEGYYSVTKFLDVSNLDKYTEIEEQNLFLAPLKTDQVVRLNNIFFKQNSDEILEESIPELKRFVKFLKTNKKIKIELASHTDNSLSPEESLKLSEKRAKNIYDYLISHGIKAKRLTYKGYGLQFPIGFNNNAEGRAMNNRIEFKITALK